MEILKEMKTIRGNELDSLNRMLEEMSPQERILWARDSFGEGLVLSTSFGAYSAVMLHLVHEVLPGIQVLFIDTGYFTPETYRFKREMTDRLNLDVRTYLPARSRAEREALDGAPEQILAREDGLEKLSAEVKVEPLERAFQELNTQAWMSGVMRGETQLRKGFSVVVPRADKLFKIHPIIDWNTQACREYLRRYDLPLNMNYFDICKPLNKECGIHLTGIDRSLISSEL